MKKRGNSRPDFLIKNKGVKSKRSQGEVITTVIIILVVLAAVVIVWNVVKGTVNSGANKAGQNDKISTSMETINVTNLNQDPINIPVTRSSGTAQIDKIRILFKDKDKNTKQVDKTDCIPGVLETKICVVHKASDLGTFIPVSYEVYPIFNNSGEIGLKADEIPCVPICAGKTCGDNGCGGSCGTCSSGQVCIAERNCCAPNCVGRVCGVDPVCGQSCGPACPSGFGCSGLGQCLPQSCKGNPSLSCVGTINPPACTAAGCQLGYCGSSVGETFDCTKIHGGPSECIAPCVWNATSLSCNVGVFSCSVYDTNQAQCNLLARAHNEGQCGWNTDGCKPKTGTETCSAVPQAFCTDGGICSHSECVAGCRWTI